MTDYQRTEVLKDLVAMRRPLDDALQAVRALPWDSDRDLVVVGPSEVALLLTRFLQSEVTAADVERWADALESREDVTVDPALPGDIMFALATPELEGSLTTTRAEELLVRLAENGRP